MIVKSKYIHITKQSIFYSRPSRFTVLYVSQYEDDGYVDLKKITFNDCEL